MLLLVLDLFPLKLLFEAPDPPTARRVKRFDPRPLRGELQPKVRRQRTVLDGMAGGDEEGLCGVTDAVVSVLEARFDPVDGGLN